MTPAGRLDRRVTVLKRELFDDGLAEVERWTAEPRALWASKVDVKDSERWNASEAAAHVTTRFQVRWSTFSAGISATDRLRCEGQDYDIVGIKEIGRREEIEITAARRLA